MMTLGDWLRHAMEIGVIQKPNVGERVLLALRTRPRSGDVQDMIDRIDEIDGLPGALDRRLHGGH